jgi:hypothetical protein
MFYDSSGLLTNVICLDITDGVVQAVRSVITLPQPPQRPTRRRCVTRARDA